MNIVERAFDCLKNGRPAEALAIYKKILAIAPDNAEVLYYVSAAYNRLNKTATAIDWIRRSCCVNPGNEENYSSFARSSLFAGRFELAAPALQRRLIFNPGDMEAVKLQGTLLHWLGRLDEAMDCQRRVLADGTDDPQVALRLQRGEAHAEIARTARRSDLPKGLVVRGAFREGSGYGHAVRQFVRHFIEAGVSVQLIDRLISPDNYMQQGQYDPLFETLDRPVQAKAVLHFTTPIEVEHIPGLQTLNYTFFEAAQISDLWARHSRRHDHVFVATESCRSAWVAAGHPPERISVCPLGVSPIDPQSIPSLVLSEANASLYFGRRHRFVNISEVTARKNLPALLRTWLRVTRHDDDCVLMIKAGTSPDSSALFQAIAAAAIADTGIPLSNAAPLFVLSGRYTDAEMLSLLASGTHYWSMSHGEGWDLPMTQAGALDLTLIAPRHSAYMDYLTAETAYLLPCRETDGIGPYDGMSWWSPDEEAAGRLLRRLIDSTDGQPRSARVQLQQHFDWKLSARRLLDELERIGAL